MKTAIISFTNKGAALAKITEEALSPLGYEVLTFRKKEITLSLSEWTKFAFSEFEAILFVGACGIAVRAIAPFVKDKFRDPAVLVMDEMGEHVISLLSGHVGGANALALKIAALTGADPVITTATDVNGKFSVDVFAKKNNLKLESRLLAKLVSAAVLENTLIPIYLEKGIQISDDLPDDLALMDYENFCSFKGLKVAVTEKRFSDCEAMQQILYLTPKRTVVGIGCRKDTPEETIEKKLGEAFKGAGISLNAIAAIASIDVKKEEKGIHALAEKLKVPFCWYDAEALLSLEGSFSSSAFVAKTVGVDCVCERSAVMASGSGALIFGKTAGDGVTIAAAVKNITLSFKRG